MFAVSCVQCVVSLFECAARQQLKALQSSRAFSTVFQSRFPTMDEHNLLKFQPRLVSILSSTSGSKQKQSQKPFSSLLKYSLLAPMALMAVKKETEEQQKDSKDLDQQVDLLFREMDINTWMKNFDKASQALLLKYAREKCEFFTEAQLTEVIIKIDVLEDGDPYRLIGDYRE